MLCKDMGWILLHQVTSNGGVLLTWKCIFVLYKMWEIF